jgi:hypothetical protein
LELMGYGVLALHYLKVAFIGKKNKNLHLNNVKSASIQFFFWFLNVSNVCGLYILTCNDSQQEGMWGKLTHSQLLKGPKCGPK